MSKFQHSPEALEKLRTSQKARREKNASFKALRKKAKLEKKLASVTQAAVPASTIAGEQDQVALESAAIARLMERIRDARKDPCDFVEFVMRTPLGVPLKLAPFQRKWLYAMANERRLLVEASRFHGKTTITIAFCLWMLGNNPNLRIKFFCQNDKRAKERLFEFRQNIEKNPAIRLVFPNLKQGENGEWTKTSLVVERSGDFKDASFEAIGITSSVTGGRADVVICDDVCDLRSSVLYPSMREQIVQKFKGEMLPMLDPKAGKIIYIATPWHRCLPANELVLTARGRVAARDVTADDLLRVAADRWEKPIALANKEVNEELIQLIVGGQPEPYTFTANHKVPTLRGDIRVDELTTDDHLLLNCGNVTELTDVELSTYERLEPAQIVKPADKLNRIRNRKCKISCEQLQADLKEGLTYGEISARHGMCGKRFIFWLVNYYGLPRRQSFNKAKPGWISNPLFWRFAGYWLAEGCFSTNNNATRLVFGFTEEERGFANDAAMCVEQSLGVRVNVRPKARKTLVEFNAKTVGKWLSDTFGCEATIKHLPAWITKLPKALLQEFIKGYWLGDGSTTSAGTRFSTSSKNLAYDLVHILATRFGVSSRLYKNTPAKTIICGNIVNSGPAYEVRCRNADGITLGLPVPVPKLIQKNWKIKLIDGKLTFPIEEIKRVPYTGKVYDFQTSTGYFDMAGITSHNSDLTSVLQQSSEWQHLRFAVGTDDDRTLPIWPEQWPRAELERMLREQGSIEYDRAFRCISYSSDSVCVKPEWIKYYTRDLLGNPLNLICIQAYDLAIAQTSNADYFAGVTVLYDTERNIAFVADFFQTRCSFAEQGNIVIRNFLRWEADRVWIETVGLGGGLFSYLEENGPKNLPLFAYKPRGDKQRRLMESTPWLENGKLFFHPNMDPQRNVLDIDSGDLITQLLEFPICKHDDLVDALVTALFGLLEFKIKDGEGGWHDGEGLKVRVQVME